MKVAVSHLNHLFKKYKDSIQTNFLNGVFTPDHHFLIEDKVLESQIKILKKNRISEIEVVYTQAFYNYLSTEFPAYYRKPFNQLRYMEFDKHLEELNSINIHSGRKRYLRLVGDLYGLDREGKREVLAGHDQLIGYDRWNYIKRHIKKDQKIYFRNSEVSIIIFVNLSKQDGAAYVNKFKKNTDLISLMVSHENKSSEKIAPDFVPTEDVISVTNPENLLDEYKKSNARLIIIGEKPDESYKRALLKVKRYDKFVRMIVVPELDHRNLGHFFREVKLIYNSDKWDY